jgi:hypothetical protein
MSLPDSVRVKLSSEAAEGISITAVVVRDMPLRELVEHMLGITGKNEARIRELLLRGTLVSGASRFRWPGWEADPQSVEALLATFPDPEPDRPFAPERCVRAVLRGGREPIDIPRQAVARKPWFRRSSFWDLLMQAASAAEMRYDSYSYKERADCYRGELAVPDVERLRAASGLVPYAGLRQRIGSVAFATLELYVERQG